ncbi:hypothetical protein HC891_20020 [Candidatus Gracilibacteria bacterium]|nr:hypothetical protein [Candidatus Gracilibacteria bacterium]
MLSLKLSFSGAPTLAGMFPIRATAHNAFGADRVNFLLTVSGDDVALDESLYLPLVERDR